MNEYLYPSCRVAFAALIHDIGKFAERAGISPDKIPEEIKQVIPRIDDNESPFNKDDSILAVTAKHHNPETFLQKIVNIAERLANEFEGAGDHDKTHVPTTRLIPLFDKLSTEKDKRENHTPEYRYPLLPLSPEAIFPVPRSNMTEEQTKKEYRELWNAFVEDVKTIHDRENWDLYLDHFDTLYSVYTQNIPSATAEGADVSLYDHSKSTAALATALWRYHKEKGTETAQALDDKDEKKFLLVQGDVSGIQSFIFDVGKLTRKHAYKLLRGRSFLISLLSECAALKLLRELGLPSSSQIMNAAGKFVIVAPNTDATKKKIDEIKEELNTWFLQRYYGEISLGLATIEAKPSDFENNNFKQLQSKIFQSLGKAKLQKFDLCRANAGVITDFANKMNKYNKGICCFDGRMPAEEDARDVADAYACKTCNFILETGEHLTNRACIRISLKEGKDDTPDIFGFVIGWDDNMTPNTVRCWDISLPDHENGSKALFNGKARRYINAYVPRDDNGSIKTFLDLAKINRKKKDGEDDVFIGKSAVMSIKGDIDDLGSLLQSGIKTPTFATMAGLSRQLNNFFTVYLPWLCQTKKEATNIYTVFAGGDDFYLIGPWLDQIRIVPTLRQKFKEYVCNRDDITFSIGMCMTGSGEDVVTMSEMAEDALEKAKKYPNKDAPTKNAVCCFGQTVSFTHYDNLMVLEHWLDDMTEKYGLSIGYVYSLLTLCEQAERAADPKHFSDAMWRSKLFYKTVRFIETSRTIENEEKQDAAKTIATKISNAVGKYKNAYKIALFTWLYQQREEQPQKKGEEKNAH